MISKNEKQISSNNMSESQEKIDDYNKDDNEYYGKRILPRSHWNNRGVPIETKQTPAAYDPTEFLPAGVPDASGRVNLNSKFQKQRVEEEKEMKETIAAAK